MKQTWKKFFAFAFAVALLAPASLLAQDEKVKEKEKDKEVKEKKDVRQIIVTAKGDKDEKIVVEVVGDKVTINGKPLEEYKDKNGDINVRINKLKDLESLTIARGWKDGVRNYSGSDDSYTLFNQDANQQCSE